MTFGETMSQNKKYLYAVGVALVVAATSYCVWSYGLHSASVPEEGEAFDAFKKSEIQKLADVQIAAEEINSKTITEAMTSNADYDTKKADYDTKKADYDTKKAAYDNASYLTNWIPYYRTPRPDAPTAPAAYTPVTIPEELITAHKEAGAEFKEFTPEQVKIFVDAKTNAIVEAQTIANKDNKFEDALIAKNKEVAEHNAKFYNDGRYNIAAGTLLAGAAGYGTFSKMTADEAAAKAAADKKALADKKAADAAAAQKAKDDQKKPTEAKVDPTTGETIATEGEGKDGENKTTDAENNDDSSGLGAWWILIILAILALAGGAVYFFVFMPKEEDEEFDAEAQVEEEL